MLLAPELVQNIIDNLRSTPRALAACSLTCREWYPPARRYIHSKFTYDGSDTYQARITAYNHRPDLAELVRVLVVDLSHEGGWPTKMGPTVELVVFSNVEELTLLCMAWGSQSPKFREYITTQLQLVKKLHLGVPDNPVTFEDFAALASMIKSFPKIALLDLQTVTLNNSYYYNRGRFNLETPRPKEVELSHAAESTLDTVVQMSKVHTLAFSLDHESAAVWEFEGHARKLGIQPLAQDLRLTCETSIMNTPKNDEELLPKLLRMFSHNVRHLELDFKSWRCSGKLSPA